MSEAASGTIGRRGPQQWRELTDALWTALKPFFAPPARRLGRLGFMHGCDGWIVQAAKQGSAVDERHTAQSSTVGSILCVPLSHSVFRRLGSTTPLPPGAWTRTWRSRSRMVSCTSCAQPAPRSSGSAAEKLSVMLAVPTIAAECDFRSRPEWSSYGASSGNMRNSSICAARSVAVGPGRNVWGCPSLPAG